MLSAKTLNSGKKAKVRFVVQGEDGNYRCTVQGIPAQYTQKALAEHVKEREIAVKLAGGFGGELEAKPSAVVSGQHVYEAIASCNGQTAKESVNGKAHNRLATPAI